MINRKDIETFVEKIGLDEDACREALPVCDRILADYADDYAVIAADKEDKKHIYDLADKMGTERDLTMLAASILLGIDAKALYDERGLDDGIYYACMREITIWTRTCKKMRGHVGFYEYGWFLSYLNNAIVRLGRLEFHQIHFDSDRPWEKHGVTVNPGDTVINMHIPEDGPLTPELVLDAFRRAYRFFDCTGKTPFVCESWLLYPGHYEFLPETSNIRKFMDNFDIIQSWDTKMSGDLWRVFGPDVTDDPAKLPRETGLQRGMADYMVAHDNKTGGGHGIFLFDGEKVLK